MRIKSFFAKSVDEAITQAREELGAEALLLNTRKLTGEAGKPGGYEVVFGLAEEEPLPVSAPRPQSTPDAPSRLASAQDVEPLNWGPKRPVPQTRTNPATPNHSFATATPAPAVVLTPEAELAPAVEVDEASPELDRLHAQMDEIRNLLARFSKHHVIAARSVPELADIYARLASAEVDSALCKAIVDGVEAAMATDAFFERVGTNLDKTAGRSKPGPHDSRRLEELVRTEMARRVGIDPKLGIEGAEGVAVLLVGPAGAGKTTSLAKLAAATVATGRPVRIFTTDPSAASPLHSLSNTFGISVTPVRARHQLPELIADARKRDVVLIDTPGFAGSDRSGLEAAADLFSKCPALDVHLVVPAGMRPNDLRRCVERYSLFRPAKLFVTRLNEARALGPAFSEAARAGLSLSFLAHGPAVPGDIRPASKEDFAAMIFDRRQARAQSVA